MKTREIKFRAWHRVPEGKWNDIDDNWEYQMNYDLAFEEYEPINDLLNSVENIMQYTGQKDKNGKEIYEGDIVRRYAKKPEQPEYNIGTIMYEAIVVYDSNVCAFVMQQGFGFKISFEFDLEIIGNIYENPELLK